MNLQFVKGMKRKNMWKCNNNELAQIKATWKSNKWAMKCVLLFLWHFDVSNKREKKKKCTTY